MICKSQARAISKIVSVALVAAGSICSPASAQSRYEQSMPGDHGTLSGPPVMAVVSIKDQRISIYDAHGGAMRAKVSSGSSGYETPIGIYSVLQKNKEHYSNVYDDAAMPFMQRITWSGVALHEGQLPGYPASHGCVRLPNSFAEQLFPLTKIGMRVIVARDQVVPVEIAHPHLLTPTPLAGTAVATQTAYDEFAEPENGPRPFVPDLRNWPERQAEMDALKAVLAEKTAEVESRKGPIADLKGFVATKARIHAAAVKSLRAADKLKKAADDKVAASDRALAYAKDPARLKPWEAAKAKSDAALLTATERLAKAAEAVSAATSDRQRSKTERAMLRAQRTKQTAANDVTRAERALAAAQLPARYKKQADAAAKAAAAAAIVTQRHTTLAAAAQAANAELQLATQDLAAAEQVLDEAVKAAAVAKRKTLPVSIFVSLKSQRLYVRQGHEPVMDVPITIADPARPIGTHVFTAVDYEDSANTLRWTAVSLARQQRREVAQLSGNAKKRGDIEPPLFLTDRDVAASALDRVIIPPEIVQAVSASVWPGTSLIISDEALHKETNNATDFIVLISGELQGGIKRRPKPKPVPLYAEDKWYPAPGYGTVYDRYGRKIRIQQPKKTLFDWW